MKNQIIEFLKQHLPAVVIFILLSVMYFPSVLEGKKIVQSDIIQAKCMQGEVNRYWENGEIVLWTNNMFSGMPVYQIWHHATGNFLGHIIHWFQKVLGDPTDFLFLGMLGVYIFSITLNVNRWIAVIAAIGYGLSSFYLISIEAGHTNKAYNMALMAPVLASVLLTLRGKLLLGALLTTYFVMLQIRANHVQITYYTVIVASVLVLFELYRHIAEKKLAEFSKAFGLLLLAALLAATANTTLLWNTYSYAKQTIRGGSSELKEKAAQTKSGGLDKEYAFAWSQGIQESFSFIVPYFSGGASGETLDESSETYKTLTRRGVSPSQASNIIQRVPTYWGNQPFTAGPIYFGAVLMFLFLFGFLITKNSLKWAMLACILLAMFLSWGKNFSLLSNFFFDYVPMYNKFRTPAMMVCVIMLFVPVLAALGLNEILNQKIDKDFLLKNLKISGSVTLGLCLALWLGSSMFSFSPDPSLNQTDTQYYENFKNATKDEGFAQDMLNALRADRESMMKSDAVRSFIFIALSVFLVYLFVQAKIKFEILAAGLALLVVIDLWGVGKRYLNDSNFVEASEYEKYFRPRPIDMEILRDTDLHFRVHDVTSDPFNSATASRNLKTIGGYHAAKLQRYQDLIEKHIRTGNMDVLNMLNAKYFIVKGNDGQLMKQVNPGALGNAWAVSAIQWVSSADDEINALTNFNPDSLVIIDERFKAEISSLPSTLTGEAKVNLTSYNPDRMVYKFESSSPQLVVFSEVFYSGNEDWLSYIDGKPVSHIRANYALRGLAVPEGNHEIVFEFKPKSYYTGTKITLASNILMLLLFVGYGFYSFRRKNTA